MEGQIMSDDKEIDWPVIIDEIEDFVTLDSDPVKVRMDRDSIRETSTYLVTVTVPARGLAPVPIQVIPAEKRPRRTVINTIDSPCYLSTSNGGAINDSAYLLMPGMQPLVLNCSEPLWVVAANTTTRVAIHTEIQK